MVPPLMMYVGKPRIIKKGRREENIREITWNKIINVLSCLFLISLCAPTKIAFFFLLI